MANLQQTLQAAKKVKNNSNANKQDNTKQMAMMTERIKTMDIDSLDNMVFGAPDPQYSEQLYESYPNGEKRPIYDPQKEMDAIKNGGSLNISNAKIPKAILESIKANPLDLQPLSTAEEDIMTEALQNRTMDIIDKLESRDSQARPVQGKQINESDYMTETPMPNIDMESLTNVIESIMDRKFKQYTSKMLTESRNHDIPSTSLMKMTNNGFMFMDSDNNVYECKMVFKGKGKVKGKQ